MSSLEAQAESIKAKIDVDLEQTGSRVSDVFLSSVRSFCQSVGSFEGFVVPVEVLRGLPVGPFKVKKFVFQVMLMLGECELRNEPDPVPEETLATLLQLLREAAPVAVSISEGAVVDLFGQIESVWGDRFPATVEALKVGVGFVVNEPVFEEVTTKPMRVHYDDGIPAEEAPKQNLVPFKQSVAGRTVHLKVKKSRDGSGKARGRFAGYEQKYYS